LDEILEGQRPSCDKSGLGYKGEDTHVEEITSKKHEVSPSKKEDNVTKQPSTQGKENFKRKKQEIKNTFLGHQSKGMKVFFMGIVIHVIDMVTKLLNVDLMKEDIMEDSITQQGVGDVIK
jgi:hypothetical protein